MRRAVAAALLVLAACSHHHEPAASDVLTCTSLNAAAIATPGIDARERDEVMAYAHTAEDARLKAAATIHDVEAACAALHLKPSDIGKPDSP